MRALGKSLRSPATARLPGLALALAFGILAASGCREDAEPPGSSNSESADIEGAGVASEAESPTSPSAPAPEAEAEESDKGPSAYAGQQLGFPGCTDGKCPQHPDSTFVPTPDDIVEKLLELAEVSPGDLVYDLGSGDGRSVIAASRIYGVKSVGVELNPVLAESSRKRVAELGLSDLVEIRTGDMFEVDLSEVDVLVLYQPPKLLERMKPQLAKLPPGARIVSHFFLIPGIEPDETVSLSSRFTNFTHKIHRWNAPLSLPPDGEAPIAAE